MRISEQAILTIQDSYADELAQKPTKIIMSYRQCAVEALIQAIAKHPFESPIKVTRDFMKKMDSYCRKTGDCFDVAYDIAYDMLLIFKDMWKEKGEKRTP